jgi:hypothetical protein
MRPFKRKSRVDRILDGIKSGAPASKPVKAGLVAAGSLAGLTAASARVSSLRRQATGRG